MMTTEQKDMLEEIRDRTARMETRMITGFSRLGVELHGAPKLTIERVTPGPGIRVHVEAFDTPLSKIRNALLREFPDQRGKGCAVIYHHGEAIGTAYF
jgi:hypothetical protein